MTKYPARLTIVALVVAVALAALVGGSTARLFAAWLLGPASE